MNKNQDYENEIQNYENKIHDYEKEIENLKKKTGNLSKDIKFELNNAEEIKEKLIDMIIGCIDNTELDFDITHEKLMYC
jgi:hypothetical protein